LKYFAFGFVKLIYAFFYVQQMYKKKNKEMNLSKLEEKTKKV